MSSTCVLVVEDFAPFRQFILSTLASLPNLHVIGELSDGLEAVHKAAELKPDIILLDIRLPNLNGIEAARQIRKLLPESKIIFLTQESSAEVVQEALSLGAQGYVVKAKAGTELLTAVEAVLVGKTFVSSSNGACFPCRFLAGGRGGFPSSSADSSAVFRRCPVERARPGEDT